LFQVKTNECKKRTIKKYSVGSGKNDKTNKATTASTIIATNRPINDWGDSTVTAVILGRILDITTILALKGKSYRLSNTSLQDNH